VGFWGVGSTFPPSASVLRALRQSVRQTPQESHRVGLQVLLVVRRWYPKRQMVAVADGGYASLKRLDRCRHLGNPIAFITRLRPDVALYEPAPPRRPGQMGRARLKGKRLANLSVVIPPPTGHR
jgi:DDE superfamily endonuclease